MLISSSRGQELNASYWLNVPYCLVTGCLSYFFDPDAPLRNAFSVTTRYIWVAVEMHTWLHPYLWKWNKSFLKQYSPYASIWFYFWYCAMHSLSLQSEKTYTLIEWSTNRAHLTMWNTSEKIWKIAFLKQD